MGDCNIVRSMARKGQICLLSDGLMAKNCWHDQEVFLSRQTLVKTHRVRLKGDK